MYKCTECGLEFENKPEYCDCGNDEFVLNDDKQENNTQIEENKAPEIKPDLIYKPSEYSKDTQIFLKTKVHPTAIIVFALCIIISLIIIFVWNPINVVTEEITVISESVNNKAIPSIDKLWKEAQKQEVQPVKPVVVQTQTIQKNAGTVPQKTIKMAVKQTVKPVTNKTTVVPKQSVQTVPVQISVINDAAKKAQEAKQKAEAEALAAAEKARKTALVKQELDSYKINLRNTIGQKIDFTKVIGDGDCVISFKIDTNGRLINRAFAKQSTNITLNNEVYKAVMATPAYKMPPSAYNNETLKLNIRFTNGNFAITLE